MCAWVIWLAGGRPSANEVVITIVPPALRVASAPRSRTMLVPGSSSTAGPWTALTSGTGRRRIVKAQAPGAQLLARVASLGSGGAQADWSDPILVTTAF